MVGLVDSAVADVGFVLGGLSGGGGPEVDVPLSAHCKLKLLLLGLVVVVACW